MKVVLMGGLGNQMFQLAFALGQKFDEIELFYNLGNARMNNRDVPEICDFILPSRVSLRSAPEKFKWLSEKIIGVNIGIHLRDTFSAKLFRSTIRFLSSIYFSFLLGNLVNVRVSTNIGFHEFRKLNNNSLVIGYFQTYRYLDSENPIELAGIQPKTISSATLKWINKNKGLNLLAIHFRLGDYRNEPSIGILDSEYFARALDTLNRESFDKIVVFTDSPGDLKSYIPRNLKNFEIAPSGSTSAESMWIMQKCSSFIIANSSFSWWAAKLSLTTKKIVVAPQPWFLDLDTPRDLIPPTWFKVKR